jgi:hypothetical protein
VDDLHHPETGTSVDFPSSIFTDQVDRPDGYGQGFRTADGQAKLIQAVVNSSRFTCCFSGEETPASNLQYRRVTSRFLLSRAIQGRQGLVRSLQLLRRPYPLRADQLSCEGEEHEWDDVVTRISLSLTGK